MKTAVLYARYSSDKQREASIDDQLRVCHDYCAREDIEVVGTYADYALSGKTDQRPEFRRMIANAPESDYVVVYMFDRFSRDRYDSIIYKRQLADCGVRVISATEPTNRTPEGQLQEGMLEVIAAYYVADLARKTRRGMEGNALQAKDNGYRIFGYKTDPDTRRYVIDEAEAEIVREVFSRSIGGDSMYSIAKDLAGRGWTTSTGAAVDYNWVNRVLKRKAYTGVYSWAGIEVEGGMPVIIDQDTFSRAQSVPKRKPRANEHFAVYKLSGKLYCGLCGCLMHGYSGTGKKGKRYYYYGCKESGDCQRKGIRRELVEDAVAEAILDITSDEDRMREVARRVVEARGDFEGEDELRRCEDRIADLEKEQRNIAMAISKGVLNDEIAARNDDVKRELAVLRARHGNMMGAKIDLDEDTIVEFLAHGFDRSDEDFIFGSVINSVHLYEGFALAVVNFREDDGDLMGVRVDLEGYLRKHPNLTSGFGCDSSGVPGDGLRELIVVPMRGGFGLVIPLAS